MFRFYLQDLIFRSQDSMIIHGAPGGHWWNIMVTIEGVQLYPQTDSVHWQQLHWQGRKEETVWWLILVHKRKSVNKEGSLSCHSVRILVNTHRQKWLSPWRISAALHHLQSQGPNSPPEDQIKHNTIPVFYNFKSDAEINELQKHKMTSHHQWKDFCSDIS